MQGVQVKLWNPLTTHAIPERFRDASCGNTIQIELPLRLPLFIQKKMRNGFCVCIFRCSKCPAEFTRQKSYLLHQRNVHHCDRNYQCETCGRAFLFETNLIRHQQVRAHWLSFLVSIIGFPNNTSLSLSLFVSVHFGCHFPDETGLASFIEAKDVEVVVATGAVSHEKLQSNCHQQQTNTQLFLRARCSFCHPTDCVKALKGNSK